MDDLPALHSVSERFRFARERAELSRARLSEELRSRGLQYSSVMQIRRYEAGDASPSVAIVEAVAALAGVDAAWIVSGRAFVADPPPQPGTAHDHGIHDGLRILGHVEAELARLQDEEPAHAVRKAFGIVGRRVERLRTEGRLDDAGYACWLALERVASLVGRYRSHDAEPGSDEALP